MQWPVSLQEENTQTHQEGCVEMDTEIRVMQQQAEEYQGLPTTPEAGKRQGWNLLEPSEGAQPGPFPDFGLIASRTVVL